MPRHDFGRRMRAAVVAVSAMAIAIAGCASMQVGSYLETGARVDGYRTYAWAPDDQLQTGDPRLDNNEVFLRRVQRAADAALQARGYEKSASGMPDLLVHFHASVTQALDADAIDRTYGYIAEEDYQPSVYDAGTLTLDLVDARSKRLVWRGWAEGSLEGAIDSQEYMEARVDEAMARIVGRLPRS